MRPLKPFFRWLNALVVLLESSVEWCVAVAEVEMYHKSRLTAVACVCVCVCICFCFCKCLQCFFNFLSSTSNASLKPLEFSSLLFLTLNGSLCYSLLLLLLLFFKLVKLDLVSSFTDKVKLCVCMSVCLVCLTVCLFVFLNCS